MRDRAALRLFCVGVTTRIADGDSPPGLIAIANALRANLEAQAMGKVVNCSRARSQVDMIQDGATSLLAPLGDPETLQRAIAYLWGHVEVATLAQERAQPRASA